MSDIAPSAYGRDYRDADEPTIVSALLKRTSWGAVMAGIVVAVSAQMVFSVLGIALGMTSVDAGAATDANATRISMAAAAWWLLTGTAALFIGGCVVGRFAGMTRSLDVSLHAVTMWAATAVFGFVVLGAGTSVLATGTLYAHNGTDRSAWTDGGAGSRVTEGRVSDVREASAPNGQDRSVGEYADAETARRAARNASWLALAGLLLGVAASVGGAYLTAPERIVVRPTNP